MGSLQHAFFNALEARDWRACRAAIAACRAAADPNLADWAQYFEGVLANEEHNDWAAAERIFRRLLPGTPAPLLKFKTQFALAKTLDYQGRWEEALAHYAACVAHLEALGDIQEQARVWNARAVTYWKGFTAGDFGAAELERAQQCCRTALDLLLGDSEAAVSPDGLRLKGYVLTTLGVIALSRRDWHGAIDYHIQDLEICRQLGDRHGMAQTYNNLGEAYQKLGQTGWPAAGQAYQKALALFQQFGNRVEETDVLANLGALYVDQGNDAQALAYYAQAADAADALRGRISSAAARADFFATVTKIYAHAVLLCLRLGRVAQAFDYAERARARAFLDLLNAQAAGRLPKPDVPTLTLADIQRRLPPNHLLIAYFTTGLAEVRLRDTQIQRHRFPPEKIVIFAVTREAVQATEAPLSPNQLRPNVLDNVVERHFLQPQMQRRLYDALIAPLAGRLAGKSHLYLIPHGPLHYIPFHALTAPDGDTLLRADGPVVTYAPSASILFRPPSRRRRPPAAGLAVGYNSAGNTQLRSAEREARDVAHFVDGRYLLAPAKQTVYVAAKQQRLLHFACHGAFNPQAPLDSFLHLAPGERLTVLDVMKHLRLNCDLVVLSACESGLSRVRRGDELDGFVRAFMLAGAPMLITTLWRVYDNATRLLMQRFYTHLLQGTEAAQALRQAQLYLKNLSRRAALQALAALPAGRAPELPAGAGDERIFSDPYYWAAFVLVGYRPVDA